MKEILAAGGSSFLIPAVLFLLIVYSTRALFVWQGRRSQQRKEFLDLWDRSRAQDNLWLEVVVRHLCGTYLPARVIRLALAQPNQVNSLVDLSELWPLLRLDAHTQRIGWKHRWHRSNLLRKIERWVLLSAYFLCAGIAALYGWAAFKAEPNSFSATIDAVSAVAFLAAGFGCLLREDRLAVAVTFGEAWIERLNVELPLLANGLIRPACGLDNEIEVASKPFEAVP